MEEEGGCGGVGKGVGEWAGGLGRTGGLEHGRSGGMWIQNVVLRDQPSMDRGALREH